jgi:hypothetical protein
LKGRLPGANLPARPLPGPAGGSMAAGTRNTRLCSTLNPRIEERRMNNIIYIIGLVVVVIAILSFFGLR